MADPRVRLANGVAPDAAVGVLRALDEVRVVVDINRGVPAPVAGAAGAAISMAARLFADVEVRGSAVLPANPWEASTVADVLDAVEAVRPQATTSAIREWHISFGDLADAGSGVAVGGGAWTVRLGKYAAIDLDEIDRYGHCLGLHAGAALAVNEIMKRALATVGMRAVPIGSEGLLWNLVDYRLAAAPDLTPQSEPRRFMFAGCGSVGGSAVAVLSLSPGLRGDAVLLDLESFDPARNPFRYPALRGSESGSKVAWGGRLLSRAGWNVEVDGAGVRSWVRGSPTPGFDGLIVSSVDEIDARRDVADLLGRDVCSVGVAGLAFHVQHERWGDGLACPFCEYVSAAPPLTQAQVIASQVGLAVERVIALQLDSAVLTEADVESAVATGKIAAASAPALVGRRLADLVARSYAEVELSATQANGSPSGGVTVAAPQVSWLAGTLAAAEVAKYGARLPLVDRRLDIDLAGLPQGFTRRVEADRSGRCLCASPHRRRWTGGCMATFRHSPYRDPKS